MFMAMLSKPSAVENPDTGIIRGKRNAGETDCKNHVGLSDRVHSQDDED
jgi:hypothetical protein